MKVKMLAAAAAMGISLVAAGAAQAQTGNIPNGGVTIQDVRTFLLNKGFKAEIKSGSTGQYIDSASGGVNFSVYMYDCHTGNRCASVQFSAGFDLNQGMTAGKINEWNRDKRYLKAYVDSEGDPYVQFDVNTSPGRTWTGFNDDFGVWVDILASFTQFIGWR